MQQPLHNHGHNVTADAVPIDAVVVVVVVGVVGVGVSAVDVGYVQTRSHPTNQTTNHLANKQANAAEANECCSGK